MYIKYLVLIGLILIILKRWNIILFVTITMIFIYVLSQILLDTKKKYDKTIEKMLCRKSDINNPMGNVLLYTEKDKLEYNLCKDQDIETKLRFNIYNDSKDLFLRKNNIRPFITMPSISHPNDIDNVKNTLYNYNSSSCKLDNTNCMYNENLKYHKNYFLSNKIIG
jgi:hypothetical protein